MTFPFPTGPTTSPCQLLHKTLEIANFMRALTAMLDCAAAWSTNDVRTEWSGIMEDRSRDEGGAGECDIATKLSERREATTERRRTRRCDGCPRIGGERNDTRTHPQNTINFPSSQREIDPVKSARIRAIIGLCQVGRAECDMSCRKTELGLRKRLSLFVNGHLSRRSKSWN
ncbi:hypothetical protein Aduo_015646 [Ancylostoma duodenale]